MNTQTPPPIAKGTLFHFGEHQFHFGDEIIELVDSSPIRDNVVRPQSQNGRRWLPVYP